MPFRTPVATSIFDLFKIGPGPSSSHTIGPMKAAGHFRSSLADLPADRLSRADRLEVLLYGSLSATGRGHGTDRALAAGLMGWEPETVDPNQFARIFAQENDAYPIDLQGRELVIDRRSVVFGPVEHDYAFNNTMDFRLLAADEVVFERRYYSVGGGFIRWDGWMQPEGGRPVYPYGSMRELKTFVRGEGLSLPEVVMANECAVTGVSREEIHARLDRILDVMEQAVQRGLASSGLLPGDIGLARKARGLYCRTEGQRHIPDRMLTYLNAYSLAASEENAAGHIVVTAPTSGSSGVIPGVLHLLKHHFQVPRRNLRQGLMAAAAIGFLIKHNASISGAEVGCQGEVGAASAMSAALLAQVHDRPVDVVANAAEIALEHHLGMTCDPIGGYVQIPCIERNAMGAVKAYNAFLLASVGEPSLQKIDLDQVIEVMLQTGRDMSRNYKETSRGGLALSTPDC